MVDSRGLLVTDATDGMDWDYYDGNKTGEVTAYNDIYYETLTDAALMADALGHGTQAATYRRDAATLRTADQPVPLRSVDRALRPLRPPARRRGPGRQRPRRPLRCGPEGRRRHHPGRAGPGPPVDALRPAALHAPMPSTGPLSVRSSPARRCDALFATGATASATSLLRTLWGYMDGPGPDATGTDWELVGADGSPGFGASTSLAHGWATGATAALSSYVLGVQPTTAGFRTWSVQPHPGTLSWVEGDVPTATRHHRRPLGPGPRPRAGSPSRSPPRPGPPAPSRCPSPAPVRSSPSRPPKSGGPTPPACSISTRPGADDQRLTVTGGATYHVEVRPR